MKSQTDLRTLLNSINHRGYPAYKDTRGSYQFDGYVLHIDHVQGDPFASPSKVSVEIKGRDAAFPATTYDQPHKRIALQDHLLRLFGRACGRYSFKAKGSGKSGLLSVSRPGQEILERSALSMNPANGTLRLRMEIGFPANGRSINATELIKILFDFLPDCVAQTLYYRRLNRREVDAVIQLAEDQQYIRTQLEIRGLCAFVANGAILPRQSGISSLPMKDAIPFTSPSSMETVMDLPYGGTIHGMGIPRGITLIVGGGYHGKSTLLKALELGVYNHIRGDGREYVITTDNAVKIRAEDGRSIKDTDISLFINHLPNGKDTGSFSTADASGSTSQAANVIEAIEAGTSLFLIDEDTCATNFMIRDELMQRVVHREQEPITPFIERVRLLYERHGISCIMVAGSSGSYFQTADHIIQMENYLPKEITAFAKEAASHFPPLEFPQTETALPVFERKPARSHLRNGERIKMKTLGKDAFTLNRETVDVRYVEQLVDSEQTTALSYLLRYALLHCCDGQHTLQQIIDTLLALLHKKGLEALADGSYLAANLTMPRPQEIYACFNRYRG